MKYSLNKQNLSTEEPAYKSADTWQVQIGQKMSLR